MPRLNFGIEDDFEIGAAILARMAVLDPERALALAEEGGAHQNQLTREVAAEWSRTDLDGALEWIAGSGSGVREMALRAVLERMGDEDRAGALAVFREQVRRA